MRRVSSSRPVTNGWTDRDDAPSFFKGKRALSQYPRLDETSWIDAEGSVALTGRPVNLILSAPSTEAR